MNEEVSHASIVVSLLPATLHPLLIDHCLDHGKHLITASYTSEAMKQVHDAATKKGILFLNEIGLDPGIDHMSCMQVWTPPSSKIQTILKIYSFIYYLVN